MTPEERDRLITVEVEMREMRESLKALLAEQKATNAFLAEIRGGRKMVWGILSAAGALGALFGWLAEKLVGVH